MRVKIDMVMLPNNEKVNLTLVEEDNGKGIKYFYLLSDEKIKEGDYYLTDAGVFKCSGFESERELSNFKKIIATNNKALIK